VFAGSSLWRDAWRRLLRNKLAVFGMLVVLVLAIASVIGPAIIARATGLTYDSIPKDAALLKSFAPFRAADGKFSWAHPMGTDNAGRDILARVLSGGQISLMVALIATFVSLVIGISYGAIAGYIGGHVDDLMMRIVDVLYSLPYVILVIVLLALLPAKTPTAQLAELFFALGAVSWLTMARIVRGQIISLKNQDFVLGGTGHRRFDA
jgi:oligopeptide transport system permease protein